METKRSVLFTNRSQTKSYEYEIVDVPRMGEYVTIYDNGKSGKSILEGTVIRVRWVYVDNEHEHNSVPTVVLDEQPI